MADSPQNPDAAPVKAPSDAVDQAISKAQDSLQSIADQAPGDIDAIAAAEAEAKAKAEQKPTMSREAEQPTTVFQCVSGSAIAGLFGYGAYNLTVKIATNFALHPFVSDNFIAVRISAAVRTLVVGMFTLATAVFGFATLGLFALGIQTILKKLQPEPPSA